MRAWGFKEDSGVGPKSTEKVWQLTTLEAVGGAAGCTAEQDLSDQTALLQHRMKEQEKERDGGGGKAGSKKEKDQVGCVCTVISL